MPVILHDIQNILRSFKMMLDFNKLAYAFVGIILSILWVLVILAFASSFRLVEISPFELISGYLISPRLGICSLLSIVLSSLQTVEWGEYLVLVVLALGLLIIWSVFAGSITRTAAVELGKGEKSGFTDSLSFAMDRLWSYFWSPLMPIMGMLFFIACNIIGGLLGKIEIAGELAVAIGFPLAILSGFLILFIGIIGVIGFFLMFPAISVEGSDAFDAMSRAYSYVLSRPLHFLSLFISIIVCGVIVAFATGYGACLVMQTTYFTVGIGMGDKFDAIRDFIAGLSGVKSVITPLSPMSMRIAALMMMLYTVLVKVTVGSIIVAFAGSACTVAYLILRKDVDGTEMDDVYTEENEEGVEIADKREENTDPVTTGKESRDESSGDNGATSE